MVGAAVCRRLSREPGVSVVTRSREQLDLCNEDAVADFFDELATDYSHVPYMNDHADA